MKKIKTISLISIMLFVSCAFLSIPSASAVDMSYSAGDLLKADFDAVYYYAPSGHRFAYPQDKYFFTWHNDFSEVNQITNEELASIPLSDVILIRPGTKLVKIQSIPTVYAVSRVGELYAIASEEVAVEMFGENWSNNVIDIQDSFWFAYTDTQIELDGTWYPDGFLLKAADSEDIYLIWDGMKLLIDSNEAFEANRFNRDYVYTTTQDILDSYEDGQVISEEEPWLTDDSQGGPPPAPNPMM